MQYHLEGGHQSRGWLYEYRRGLHRLHHARLPRPLFPLLQATSRLASIDGFLPDGRVVRSTAPPLDSAVPEPRDALGQETGGTERLGQRFGARTPEEGRPLLLRKAAVSGRRTTWPYQARRGVRSTWCS